MVEMSLVLIRVQSLSWIRSLSRRDDVGSKKIFGLGRLAGG